MVYIRWGLYFLGLIIFGYGIAITIKVQHLGLPPWDVLHVALYERLGLSIGTWTIIIGAILIVISFFLDKSYIKLGTFINVIVVGAFVDFFLWVDCLPPTTYTWIDIPSMLLGIVLMGLGGGMYNAAHVGAGPRDGFMLSLSEKLNTPIRRVKIIIESGVLIIGLLLGGPVFIITFIFTFVQSPLFQSTYLFFTKIVSQFEHKTNHKKVKRTIS